MKSLEWFNKRVKKCSSHAEIRKIAFLAGMDPEECVKRYGRSLPTNPLRENLESTKEGSED